MTTTAATWFYRDPERVACYLEERVNQTFWQARFGALWLDCVRAEPPYHMSGIWREAPVEIEWQPNAFFILRVSGDADPADLVNGVSRILALKPALSYTDGQDRRVTEWHVNGGKDRWQEIQDKPTFRNPQRLSR
jgi:hypothetical protein